MRHGDAPILFLGHHKCATSWITEIFSTVCRELGLRHAIVHQPRMFGYDLARFVSTERLAAVAYTNAEYQYVEPLRHFRGFHVVRDPRDVSVSAYFSHLYSHGTEPDWPELEELRRQLQALPRAEGLLEQIKELQWEFDCMREWNYADSRILEVKMEVLTGDPYREFLRIFRFLDVLDAGRFSPPRRTVHSFHRWLRAIEVRSHLRIPLAPRRLPAERILGVVWENEFAKKTAGRERGEEDPRNHYRKGVAGDWRNHFGPEHIAYFKRHYATVLRELRYEQDPNWS